MEGETETSVFALQISPYVLLRCSADPINVDLESVLQSRLCVNKMETQKHILWPGKIEAALQGQDSTAATGDTLMRNTETAFSPC